MFTGAQYFYGIAAAAFVITSLVVAAVRWFHMCRPYGNKPDYYYPGRRATTLIYLSAIFLIPYIVLPDNTGAWLLAKAYFLPADLFFLAILLLSYFATVMHWRRWRRPTLLLGLLALLALLSGPAVSLLGGGINGYQLGNWIIYGLGAFMTGFCILAIYIVLRWVRKIDVDDYSNPEDFPVNFARKMIRMMVVTMVLLWITALSDSRAVMAGLNLLLIVTSVLMLVTALHPHRHRAPDEKPAPEAHGGTPLPASRTQALAAAVRRVVEEEEAFLDSHLTLQDVATRCGTSRTYIASVFKTEFGGFFTYVNTLRLQYASKYREAHPNASIAEVASESGFGSRQTYYTVKAKFQQPDA